MSTLLTIGIVALVVWLLLWLGLGVVSGLVHLLAIVGIVLIIWGLIDRSRAGAGPPR